MQVPFVLLVAGQALVRLLLPEFYQYLMTMFCGVAARGSGERSA